MNRHLLAALGEEWQVALCGPRGCREFAPPGSVVMESSLRPLPLFLVSTLQKAVFFSIVNRPGLVLGGSGLTAPIAWLAGRISGAKTAVYLHGLDVVASSRIYQWVWLPFIRGCDLVIVNSENTAKLARARGVASNRISVLNPGTDIPTLGSGAGPAFRDQHGLGQRRLLLSVGRLTRRKGLAEFVANSLPGIVLLRRDVLLLIIGDEAGDALNAGTGSERKRIQAAAEAAGVESSLRFLGHCDESTLHGAYEAADCHVFPILELPGDVEGFGMVALESAAHDLQTVAFAVGGVADSVSAGNSGSLINAGDYADFGEAVIAVLDRPRDPSEHSKCREFASDKSWVQFGKRLRRIVRQHDEQPN